MNTITASGAAQMIAAGINLSEVFPGGVTIVADGEAVVTPATKPAKVDGRNHAARKHNYDRRIHRFETTERGGLTKAQRRTLAAELRSDLGREYTAEEWDAAVGHFKKALRAGNAR